MISPSKNQNNNSPQASFRQHTKWWNALSSSTFENQNSKIFTVIQCNHEIVITKKAMDFIQNFQSNTRQQLLFTYNILQNIFFCHEKKLEYSQMLLATFKQLKCFFFFPLQSSIPKAIVLFHFYFILFLLNSIFNGIYENTQSTWTAACLKSGSLENLDLSSHFQIVLTLYSKVENINIQTC